MNKSDLTRQLSMKTNITKKQANEIIKILFESLSNALMDNDRIEIRGFGSFVIREYNPYVGRNPRTGDSIKVSTKRLPFFKVGKDLKERVNSK
ncbi:MAG: HU family DNA-binding protein [Pseudomonadota bacterium]